MYEKIQTQYMVVSFSHKKIDITMREKLNIKEEDIVPF